MTHWKVVGDGLLNILTVSRFKNIMFVCCLTKSAALAAFSIRDFICHCTSPEEETRRDVTFFENDRSNNDMRTCVTWVEACVWAEPPSAGPSEPVRTTPSVNGSKGASIYLPTENQALSFFSTKDF